MGEAAMVGKSEDRAFDVAEYIQIGGFRGER